MQPITSSFFPSSDGRIRADLPGFYTKQAFHATENVAGRVEESPNLLSEFDNTEDIWTQRERLRSALRDGTDTSGIADVYRGDEAESIEESAFIEKEDLASSLRVSSKSRIHMHSWWSACNCPLNASGFQRCASSRSPRGVVSEESCSVNLNVTGSALTRSTTTKSMNHLLRSATAATVKLPLVSKGHCSMLDFGSMASGSSRSHAIILSNPSPVKVSLRSMFVSADPFQLSLKMASSKEMPLMSAASVFAGELGLQWDESDVSGDIRLPSLHPEEYLGSISNLTSVHLARFRLPNLPPTLLSEPTRDNSSSMRGGNGVPDVIALPAHSVSLFTLTLVSPSLELPQTPEKVKPRSSKRERGKKGRGNRRVQRRLDFDGVSICTPVALSFITDRAQRIQFGVRYTVVAGSLTLSPSLIKFASSPVRKSAKNPGSLVEPTDITGSS